MRTSHGKQIATMIAICLSWVLNNGGRSAWGGGLVITWLFFCGLFYVHLVTMQIYHRVDQQLIEKQLERSQYGEDA